MHRRIYAFNVRSPNRLRFIRYVYNRNAGLTVCTQRMLWLLELYMARRLATRIVQRARTTVEQLEHARVKQTDRTRSGLYLLRPHSPYATGTGTGNAASERNWNIWILADPSDLTSTPQTMKLSNRAISTSTVLTMRCSSSGLPASCKHMILFFSACSLHKISCILSGHFDAHRSAVNARNHAVPEHEGLTATIKKNNNNEIENTREYRMTVVIEVSTETLRLVFVGLFFF